jgi:hypothetical protein
LIGIIWKDNGISIVNGMKSTINGDLFFGCHGNIMGYRTNKKRATLRESNVAG